MPKSTPENRTSESSARLRLLLRSALASGHFFFCRRIELPPGLEREEEPGAVELELEKLSPFPLEHLHYGYCVDAPRRYAFVYAAYKRRFDRETTSGWNSLDCVFPDFAWGLLSSASGASALALRCPDSFVLLEFDGKSTLPAAFKAIPAPLDAGEEAEAMDRAAALEDWAKEQIGQQPLRVYCLSDKVYQSLDGLELVAAELGTDAEDSRQAPREEAWLMDIRDKPAIASARASESRSQFAWKIAVAGLAAMGLLVLGELSFGLGQGYLAARQNLNTQQEAPVERINSMQGTVSQLKEFRQAKVDPFAMLATLTALDPANNLGVQFKQVETSGPYGLVVEASTKAGVSAVNRFRDVLRKLDNVATVEERRPSRTTNRGVEFEFYIQFHPRAFSEVTGGIASNG